jgi:DNA-binding transcriptional MerR regulator
MITFTIQEAAKQAGVSTHTLRYYERMNLLDSINRDRSGYRQFTSSDLACVEFLTRLRSTKMPIRQMQVFAELRRQGISTSHQRRLLLEKHYDAVIANQQELNHSLEVISRKIAYYKELEAKEIRSEEESLQVPTYESMVSFPIKGGMRHRSINISLEPEAAAQDIIRLFEPDSRSRLIELLQAKTNPISIPT